MPGREELFEQDLGSEVIDGSPGGLAGIAGSASSLVRGEVLGLKLDPAAVGGQGFGEGLASATGRRRFSVGPCGQAHHDTFDAVSLGVDTDDLGCGREPPVVDDGERRDDAGPVITNRQAEAFASRVDPEESHVVIVRGSFGCPGGKTPDLPNS